ncbi:MAG: HAMP domain-containing histidine kinase [Deltaproteobacteria bacterium]|nr:HAMP domain-containing histidine kinase [Deltaproteobacteria bacterium]
MRLRFAFAAALPALAALAAMALLSDRLARRALEAELGARLVAVAQAAAAGLPAERVEGLRPGDEETRTYGHVRARLESLARATGTRLLVLRPDRTAVADSEGRWRIGEPVAALERDRLEVAEAAAGRALPSQVLFEGTGGALYKTGYAPLSDGSGRTVAVVAADGTAPSFATLQRFRSLLLALALAGALAGAAVAAAAALSVTRPLRQLSAAARRIGEGDLDSALPPAGSSGEVEALRRTLEEMRQALQARDRERATMLAGIAHEVRNPLGAMGLFAGALASDLAGRPEAAHVARIQAELAALARLVEDFLDYARARPLAPEEIDAAELAAELAALAGPLASERGVPLGASGDGRFRGDRHLLRRAGLNLLRNAVEASPPGQPVEVAVAVRGGEAALEVRDRGPGLSAEAAARLFEPFFTTKERGTGLGLALAQQAALAHGGRLEVGPRPGGGAEARLVLPAKPAA